MPMLIHFALIIAASFSLAAAMLHHAKKLVTMIEEAEANAQAAPN